MPKIVKPPAFLPIQKTGEAAATLTGRQAAASKTPRSPSPVGFYVHDTISGRMMLIDTGAMRSVFQPSREDCKHLLDLAASLTAANGSLILSYGTRLLSVSILGWRYKWNFITADVRTPLLGVDFLAHLGLAVDIGRNRLMDTKSYQSLPTVCSIAPHQYASLLKEFQEVFKPKLRRVPGAPTKHRIYHHIKTRSPPTHAKSHKEHLRHIQKVLQRLQENGLIVRFDKCTFGVNRVKFLGHEISPGRVHPVASKVKTVVRFPTPTSVKAVQEFLGMVNYYRRSSREVRRP
ncbi:uncharacterized protein [Macrobrachium rosenbergii]|uniref:uncharacterized protein n=1 Tax=Macrobrachium rosenbergii TaxID=79674 RepID=UPI0034D4725E